MARRSTATVAATTPATATRRRTGGPAAGTTGGMARAHAARAPNGSAAAARPRARSGTTTPAALAEGIVASVAGSLMPYFGTAWKKLGEQGQAAAYTAAEKAVMPPVAKGLPGVIAGALTPRELAKGAATAAVAAFEPHLGPAWKRLDEPGRAAARRAIVQNVTDRIARYRDRAAAGAAT